MLIPKILSRFQDQVRLNPLRLAIQDARIGYSYRDLNRASDAVAAHLLAQGVKPSDRVVLHLPRTANWITATLGIIKAGATFIPLDPNYPEARLAYCAEDSAAAFAITENATKSLAQATLVDINEALADTRRLKPPHVDLDSLAYVLYTSGSTGQPKGVMIKRSSLDYHMSWMTEAFDWSHDDVFLQRTSTGFDASIWEYLTPLMIGARVQICENDLSCIASAISYEGVTVAQFVPSILSAIVDAGYLDEFRALRFIFCGGEALSVRLVRKIQAVLPIPIVNLYGPTEATIQCSYFVAMPDMPLLGDWVPIGRAIPGTRFDLKDRFVEDGCDLGELVITGPGVAVGYLNRNTLNDQCFTQSPNGERSYRTGDLVSQDETGEFTFRGRVDRQIKLRGIRIELGDIEEVLKRSVPGISEVIVRVDESENLIAISESTTAWNRLAAKPYLDPYLPEYMHPLTYFSVKELPRFPNGKLDRNAAETIFSEIST